MIKTGPARGRKESLLLGRFRVGLMLKGRGRDRVRGMIKTDPARGRKESLSLGRFRVRLRLKVRGRDRGRGRVRGGSEVEVGSGL
jgi:ribosomal protein L19E